LRAARRPEVVAGLEAVFAHAAAAIEARGPACWASGRCCNFESAGHRLYTTGLEAAYTVVRLDARRSAAHSAMAHQSTLPSPFGWPGGALTLPQIGEARDRGGCPFQQSNLCGVHEIKPVACRVYFCDRSAQTWQHDLSEHLHEQVRLLQASHGIEYLYAEWRTLLEMLAGESPGSA